MAIIAINTTDLMNAVIDYISKRDLTVIKAHQQDFNNAEIVNKLCIVNINGSNKIRNVLMLIVEFYLYDLLDFLTAFNIDWDINLKNEQDKTPLDMAIISRSATLLTKFCQLIFYMPDPVSVMSTLYQLDPKLEQQVFAGLEAAYNSATVYIDNPQDKEFKSKFLTNIEFKLDAEPYLIEMFGILRSELGIIVSASNGLVRYNLDFCNYDNCADTALDGYNLSKLAN